jgi:hypothetical protein
VRLDPANPGRASDLVVEDVAFVAQQDLVAGTAVHQHADEVGHGATGDKQSRFLAQPLSRQRLKPVHRRVVTKNVVADLGIRHGAADRFGRAGHRVASQVDEWFQFPSRSQSVW